MSRPSATVPMRYHANPGVVAQRGLDRADEFRIEPAAGIDERDSDSVERCRIDASGLRIATLVSRQRRSTPWRALLATVAASRRISAGGCRWARSDDTQASSAPSVPHVTKTATPRPAAAVGPRTETGRQARSSRRHVPVPPPSRGSNPEAGIASERPGPALTTWREKPALCQSFRVLSHSSRIAAAASAPIAAVSPQACRARAATQRPATRRHALGDPAGSAVLEHLDHAAFAGSEHRQPGRHRLDTGVGEVLPPRRHRGDPRAGQPSAAAAAASPRGSDRRRTSPGTRASSAAASSRVAEPLIGVSEPISSKRVPGRSRAITPRRRPTRTPLCAAPCVRVARCRRARSRRCARAAEYPLWGRGCARSNIGQPVVPLGLPGQVAARAQRCVRGGDDVVLEPLDRQVQAPADRPVVVVADELPRRVEVDEARRLPARAQPERSPHQEIVERRLEVLPFDASIPSSRNQRLREQADLPGERLGGTGREHRGNRPASAVAAGATLGRFVDCDPVDDQPPVGACFARQGRSLPTLRDDVNRLPTLGQEMCDARHRLRRRPADSWTAGTRGRRSGASYRRRRVPAIRPVRAHSTDQHRSPAVRHGAIAGLPGPPRTDRPTNGSRRHASTPVRTVRRPHSRRPDRTTPR